MFTRILTMKLKANSIPEFTHLNDNEIIPLLRRQKGFYDEATFVSPERSEVIAISLWDTDGSAEAYSSIGYPEVLEILSRVVEGTPRLESFELANSKSHKLVQKAA